MKEKKGNSQTRKKKSIDISVDVRDFVNNYRRRRKERNIMDGFALDSRKMSFDPTGLHILVVDDEPVSRLVAKNYLKRAGYAEVEIVTCAKDAKSILEDKGSDIDLILSDMNMPGESGLDLLLEVKKNPITKHIPFVLMSAVEELDIVYECLDSGGDDYILKPLRMEVVKHLWQNVWRKRKENKYITQLQTEKIKNDEKDQQVRNLNKEIRSLRGKMDEAVEAPIKSIVSSVSDLLQTNLKDEVRTALTQIVQGLSQSDLYRPRFESFCRANSGLDETTRKWLQTEIFQTHRVHNTHEESKMVWPVINSENGVQKESSWEFNPFTYTNEHLLVLAESFFLESGLDFATRFKLEKNTLRNFLLQVSSSYKNTSYHNFRHSCDVLQGVHVFITTFGAAKKLNFLEVFALYIAAVCHDLGHLGLNNQFLIQTEHELALQYNDRSVMENHHARLAFEIMKKPGCNILENLSKEESREVRRLVIEFILATDMTRHMEIMSKFRAISDDFDRENTEHRMLLAMCTLKSADIGNPSRPYKVARLWASMYQDEIFVQGDMERGLQLKVSPFMDRENPTTWRMQVNFIRFVVLDLFNIMKKLFPKVSVCIQHLETNLENYNLLLQASSD